MVKRGTDVAIFQSRADRALQVACARKTTLPEAGLIQEPLVSVVQPNWLS